MFRIAIQFLRHKKQSTLMILLVIAFAFTLVFSIVPLFAEIKNSITGATYDKYGEHHSITYDLSLEQIEVARKDPSTSRLGIITNYGRFEIKNTTAAITLGSFDAEALSMGHIRVEEGRLPETETEIALEKNILLRLETDYQIGDKFIVEQEDEAYEYTITGFLSTYTGVWIGSNELRYGFNDLPQGIIIPNLKLTGHLNCMWIERNAYYSDGTLLVGLFNKQYTTNSFLSIIFMEQIEPLEMFQNIFLLLSLVGCGFALYTALNLYLDQYKNIYQTLYNLGAEEGFVFRVYVVQQGCLLFSGIVLGFVLGAVFCSADLSVYFNLFSNGSIVYVLLLLTIVVSISYRAYKRKVQRLRGKSLSFFKRDKTQQLRIWNSLTFSLMWHYVKTNYKKMIAVVILVGILVSIVSFTQLYFNRFDFHYSVFQDLPADYFVNAGDDAFTTIGPVALELTKNRFLPKRTFQELYNYEGVRYVNVEYAMNRARLLVEDTGDPYWKNKAKDVSDQDYDASQIANLPQNVIPVHEAFHTKIFVLNDFNKAFFSEAYPQIDVGGLKEGEAIVFLPPAKRFEHLENSEVLYNKTLKVGDPLRFGYLYSELHFFDALEDLSSIEYRENQLAIAQILEEPFVVNANGIPFEVNEPMIIVSEETLLNSQMFVGVAQAFVYLDEDISEKAYWDVSQFIRKLGSSADYVQVYSLQEEIAQNEKFKAVVNRAMSYVIIVLGAFCIATMFATQYLTIMERKQSFAIFRALGMKRRQLFYSVLLEFALYIIVAFALSFLLYFAVMHRIFSVLMYFELQGKDLFTVLGIAGIGSGLCLLVGITSSNILMHNIYKESIPTAMRSGE